MTCFGEIDDGVGCDVLRLDVCPILWMWNDVCETWSGVWLTRMVSVDEAVGSVVVDVDLVQQCVQEVEMRWQSKAFRDALSWS